MKARVFDSNFKYVPANKTDISKTFARERARLKAEAEKKAKEEAEKATVVRNIHERR
jgi:predicted Ser/Thr protein kinase